MYLFVHHVVARAGNSRELHRHEPRFAMKEHRPKAREVRPQKLVRQPLRSVSFVAFLLLGVLGFYHCRGFSPLSVPFYSASLAASRFWGPEVPPPTSLGAPNHIRKSNGLTDLVEWDEYSLFVKNQRVFIWLEHPTGLLGVVRFYITSGPANFTHGAFQYPICGPTFSKRSKRQA